MFENSSLQELYTGSLIAGKGKHLNNIKSIMERTKFRHEDWARVRFGAGTPWRRCWCVIEPPDEKEWQKATKTMKKRSAYERPAYPKGDIKFYDTKKTKKVTPIATITDAYAAYAIYPQSKPLIDQSTLIKLEGKITIHSTPESKTEGFVFIMPELHAAVSGFEMLLRCLFPVYDIFQLYGRPSRLIADTLDAKGLMFAMPKQRRYGYLDIQDVASLIHTTGSDKWTEREWRKQLKELTSRRMSNMAQNRSSSNLGAGQGFSNSTGSRVGLTYQDEISPSPVNGTPPLRGHHHSMSTTDVAFTPPKPRAQPPVAALPGHHHTRSASESIALSPPKQRQENPYQASRLSLDRGSPDSGDMASPPVMPPAHRQVYGPSPVPNNGEFADSRGSSDSSLSLQRQQSRVAEDVNATMQTSAPPVPVAAPPSFQHQPTDVPQRRPDARPDMRREKSRMSNATLEQMAEVNRMRDVHPTAGAAASAAWKGGRQDPNNRGVTTHNPDDERLANPSSHKAMVADEITQSPTDVTPSSQRQASEHSIRRKPITGSSLQHNIPLVPQSEGIAELMMARTRSSERAAADSAYERESSPDYSSTRPSEDRPVERPTPRPRTGVLKTVGDPSLSDFDDRRKPDIPDIDFGVTQSLTPGPSRPVSAMGLSPSGSRPGTAMGISSDVSRSSTAMGMVGPQTPEKKSPLRTPEALANAEKRNSYFGRPSHSRPASYAWQPGMATGRQSPGRGLSAEDFVHQRFMLAQQPGGYVPQRSVSANVLETTPPKPAQNPKKLQKKRDSRPSSRNSTHLLDYSSKLSAREQEHVAAMTGGPLLSMPARTRTPDPSVGLIGAIEAREQERKQMKEGVSGHMVQAAIAQHQHHAKAQQAQAQAQAQAQQDTKRMSAQYSAAYSQQYQQYPGHQPQSQYTGWGAVVDPNQLGDQYPGQPGQQAQQWQMAQQYQHQPPPSAQPPYDQQKYGGYYR